ncbi:hypothetical protein BpHYR1_004149 [Brachionus plicatilis]|uniref:Uncharacterized protein n=1 Tax=Brachionus plicatilis TaxID=10195 RepID=A0A3M7SXX4_BRAPC|nr:hypothetical protein BpHYR1_004149 [Brachionus plicatilis]
MTKVQLNKLKKAFDHKDNISQRQAAKKFDISQQMVSKLSYDLLKFVSILCCHPLIINYSRENLYHLTFMSFLKDNKMTT